MLQTDDDTGREAPSNLDTLSAADAQVDLPLDDRLLYRNLKSQLFGSSPSVRIGRYEILRSIGRGGMGTVYVAHDPELDRKVALKVLRADRRGDRERMLNEARALARLAHPNVVTVHEVGLHDERVYVAMELIEGRTLRSWLESAPSREAIYDVFAQAARGLREAHRAGLVHRDFKPENVLIGDDGRVRVVDFGVAKATDSLDPEQVSERAAAISETIADLTHTGQLLGTPAYMAAEQFLGASVDARTDVFAFCVTLYEALAGRRPFPGDDTARVCQAVLDGEYAPLTVEGVPAGLAKLIEQGLARQAEDRPQSIDGLLDALELARAPAGPRPIRWGRWIAGIALGTGGLTVAAGATSAMFVLQPSDEPTPVAAATSSAGDEGGQTPTEPSAEDHAFAAIVAAADDTRRHAAAKVFLDAHGDSAAAYRRAIAHSILGDSLWRASCPVTFAGLCAERVPLDDATSRCVQPKAGPLVRKARDQAKAEAALEHLDLTLGLAGIEPPEDETEARLFLTSVGRARVQRADHELEQYLDIRVPEGLDFKGAQSLSSDAFRLFFQEKSRIGSELTVKYAAVKKSVSPQWILVAAAHTGVLSESFANALGTAPLPDDFDDDTRQRYCDAIAGFTEPSREVARNAYAYCVGQADEHEITSPEAELCREQLQRLGPPQPRPKEQ